MPCTSAANHLVFADSPHSIFLLYPSVKSREQTQSKFSLLQKTFFIFSSKEFLVTHSKSCAPCLGFKVPHQKMGILPFHLNLSPLPGGPQCYSVAKSCLTLCVYMYGNRTGFTGFRCFAEFPQTHVHCVGDAKSPFYPFDPFLSAHNLSQHQGLFQ